MYFKLAATKVSMAQKFNKPEILKTVAEYPPVALLSTVFKCGTCHGKVQEHINL